MQKIKNPISGIFLGHIIHKVICCCCAGLCFLMFICWTLEENTELLCCFLFGFCVLDCIICSLLSSFSDFPPKCLQLFFEWSSGDINARGSENRLAAIRVPLRDSFCFSSISNRIYLESTFVMEICHDPYRLWQCESFFYKKFGGNFVIFSKFTCFYPSSSFFCRNFATPTRII